MTHRPFLISSVVSSRWMNRKCDFEFSEVAQNKYNYEVIYGNQPTTRRMYKLIIPVE